MTREEARGLLQAYADGELDPAKVVELEAHLATDPASRAACERLRSLSATIREKADYHAAPASLGERLLQALPALPEEKSERQHRVQRRWPVFAAALACTAALSVALTLAVVQPGGGDERLEQDALASHVRATLSARLTDVRSSDQHTVKPWLSERLPYSPPVADFSAQGFALIGARVDYIGSRTVAVLVYQRRQHRIDVFVWPEHGDAALRTSAHEGFHVERFAREGMRYWLVSDLNGAELNDLARLLGAS